MQTFALCLLVIVTASGVITATAVLTIANKFDVAINKFFLRQDEIEEADTVKDVTVTDALLRIEEASASARMAAVRTAERVEVATELGFQNAEANTRLEDTNAHVAENLIKAQATVDSVAQNLSVAQGQVDDVAKALLVSDEKIVGVASALAISDERVAQVAAQLKVSKELVAAVAADLQEGHLRAINISDTAVPGEAADAAAKGPSPV